MIGANFTREHFFQAVNCLILNTKHTAKLSYLFIGLWKKLKQKMDKRAIQQALNIGHEKWKHS